MAIDNNKTFKTLSFATSLLAIIISGVATVFSYGILREEESSLKLIVVDSKSEVVSDATITVEFENGKDLPLTAKTNERGLVNIQVPKSSKELPATLTIEAPGYKLYRKNLSAAADIPSLATIKDDEI
ncbi:MAG: hypothetical protein AB4372_22400 [Xenococcus sp. (in: cyanobacteria)]